MNDNHSILFTFCAPLSHSVRHSLSPPRPTGTMIAAGASLAERAGGSAAATAGVGVQARAAERGGRGGRRGARVRPRGGLAAALRRRPRRVGSGRVAATP